MAAETEGSKVFDLEEPIDRDHEKLLYERLLFVSIIEIHQRLLALERGYVHAPIEMNFTDLRAGQRYLENDIVSYTTRIRALEEKDNSRCTVQGRHCGNPTCTKFHGVPDGSNNSQGT